VIGLALLLTYRGSGATWNAIPTILGVTNPCILVGVILLRGGQKAPLKLREYVCAALSLSSLVVWCLFRGNEKLSTYALCLAIVADVCAAVPSIVDGWTNPHDDRPGAWAIFSFGYLFALPAITEWKFSNIILPVYMSLLSVAIVIPLVRYRIKHNIPLKEWI
jgi:hypothetical protein